MATVMKFCMCKDMLRSTIHGLLSNNFNNGKLTQATCKRSSIFCNYSGLLNKFASKPHKRAKPLKIIEDVKVCVIGASGSVGSKIAMLLKVSPVIKSLSLYDIKTETEVVFEELSRIPSNSTVDVFCGRDKLTQALKGSKIVVICASDKRLPEMSLADLFEPNAAIAYDIAKACAKTCPTAKIVLVSQPVESLLPLVSEVYKEHYVYESRKLLGSTSANVMRSITLMSEGLQCSPFDLVVPVIGGHSQKTIVPVFSQAYPDPSTHHAKPDKRAKMKELLLPYTKREQSELVQANIQEMNLIVRNSEEWVFRTKYQESSAIAGATSAASTTLKLIQAMNKLETKVHDYAYVKTDAVPGVTYSTTLVRYGPHGIFTGHPTHVKSAIEQELLREAVDNLRLLIAKGEEYVRKRQ